MFVRPLVASLLVVLAAGLLAPAAAGSVPSDDGGCPVRTLVLSAYPAEADAVLSHVTLADDPVVVIDGHHFYIGTLAGKPVATAMTGIGLANATSTATAALDGIGCASHGSRLGAVVFSGVAGGAGRTSIGDVAVPARWTLDDGATWQAVDPSMLAAADVLGTTSPPTLSHVNTAGDPGCTCVDPSLVPLVDLGRIPAVFVGGDGYSSDSLGGKASPCVPGGGDTFGCTPCRAPDRPPLDPTAAMFGALSFLQSNTSSSGTTSASGRVYDAVDEETAAVQMVADAHGVPFLGFRGMSDGPGDPLHLPGFPFQFFVYKQIAADNSAKVVEAFLSSWSGPTTSSDVGVEAIPASEANASAGGSSDRSASGGVATIEHTQASTTAAARESAAAASPSGRSTSGSSRTLAAVTGIVALGLAGFALLTAARRRARSQPQT